MSAPGLYALEHPGEAPLDGPLLRPVSKPAPRNNYFSSPRAYWLTLTLLVVLTVADGVLVNVLFDVYTETYSQARDRPHAAWARRGIHRFAPCSRTPIL